MFTLIRFTTGELAKTRAPSSPKQRATLLAFGEIGYEGRWVKSHPWL
jgi:hypothetical protein